MSQKLAVWTNDYKMLQSSDKLLVVHALVQSFLLT